MPEFLASGFSGSAFAIGATAIVLGSYALARKFRPTGGEADRTSKVARSVAFWIAALYGLILGLVYAQELRTYKDIQTALTDEANAISDIYNDMRRYGGGEVGPVLDGLEQYVTTVVDSEWDSLGQDKGLSPKAWTDWEGIYGRLLGLEPITERERWLANRMRVRLTDIAELREKRGAGVDGRLSSLFWTPALVGLALISIPFYVFRPTPTHLVLLSTFSIYSGVILFVIYAFSNPFRPPGKLEPVAFERLLHGRLNGTSSPG